MSNDQLYKHLTISEKKAAALEAAARIYEGQGYNNSVKNNIEKVIKVARKFEEYLKEKQ